MIALCTFLMMLLGAAAGGLLALAWIVSQPGEFSDFTIASLFCCAAFFGSIVTGASYCVMCFVWEHWPERKGES